MVDPTISVTTIAIGSRPNNEPGAMVVLTLSDGSNLSSFLLPDQARGLAQQILATINERPILPQPKIIGIDF